ncbi:adenosine deaminase [Candidatus Bathyarchaeota archaeon]|nr:adenosine deaminase [Candidatus Bathyarchaeota archaeon]
MDTERLIRALPKVEQHVHIVGSTKPETLLWLMEKSDTKPFKTVDDVRSFFQYRDFPHFISIYCTVMACITDETQFERLTYEMLDSNAKCNVQYVEASFSAPDHVLRGLDYGKMLNAINRGVSRARNDFGVECNLRIDLVRNYGPKVGMQILDLIESKNDNIVSVDIGGSEERFPPKPYVPVFQRAKKMGLHLVAHAGEAAGPESVWEAVKQLGVERIGHGVAASTDPKLMQYLLEHGVAIEACPTSNVKTGVVKTLEKHPIKTFFQKGIKVSANTDDPSMFGTDMNNEYLQLYHRLNFTIPQLFKLTLNAIESSFLSEKHNDNLRESSTRQYQRLMNNSNK